jgi:hypothetical protein
MVQTRFWRRSQAKSLHFGEAQIFDTAVGIEEKNQPLELILIGQWSRVDSWIGEFPRNVIRSALQKMNLAHLNLSIGRQTPR